MSPGITYGSELPVYSGSVLRTRDASAMKVEAPANHDGKDIALPISKLHRVSGAVLASDGAFAA